VRTGAAVSAGDQLLADDHALRTQARRRVLESRSPPISGGGFGDRAYDSRHRRRYRDATRRILVWQDMAGLTGGGAPACEADASHAWTMLDATRRVNDDVSGRALPGSVSHSYTRP